MQPLVCWQRPLRRRAKPREALWQHQQERRHGPPTCKGPAYSCMARRCAHIDVFLSCAFLPGTPSHTGYVHACTCSQHATQSLRKGPRRCLRCGLLGMGMSCFKLRGALPLSCRACYSVTSMHAVGHASFLCGRGPSAAPAHMLTEPLWPAALFGWPWLRRGQRRAEEPFASPHVQFDPKTVGNCGQPYAVAWLCGCPQPLMAAAIMHAKVPAQRIKRWRGAVARAALHAATSIGLLPCACWPAPPPPYHMRKCPFLHFARVLFKRSL